MRSVLRPLLFVLLPFALLAGCAYSLKLDRVDPLKAPPSQPLAILPIPDAQGYPRSGDLLTRSVYEQLKAKGYRIVSPEEVARGMEASNLTIQDLMADPRLLSRLPPALQARSWLGGEIVSYQIRKSHVDSKTFQVWEGAIYDYRALPTYLPGTFQVGLRLRVITGGREIWQAEGSARGPDQAVEKVGRRLVAHLLEAFPPGAAWP
ncbi:MAG: hypothetical protein HY697_03560 [Deltaproteobacteria bacterium]|nr:hypothetical protein [Deltaproteobacteria bacterium]